MSTADKDGADLIRIAITGSILAPSPSALHQQMNAAEVTAIMEAAHGMGKKVSAHAHGLPGIRAPAATSNSPTRGQVKIPHLTTAGAVSVYAV